MLDANELFHKPNETGSEWAEYEAAYQMLEDSRNAVLSRLMLDSDATSAAKRS